jgi:cell surface protein SprA
MNLFERPLTQKVNFGEDPINNKMYGVDFRISKDAPWLTKLVDKLPLISTKEPSNITAQAELAWLQPGHNSAINQGDTGGTVYIDDFEGSTSNLPLGIPANAWVIASVPQGDLTLFPESNETSLALGANRAGLSWYIADPSALDGVDGSNPYTATIQYQDLFPNRQLTPLEQSSLRPFDVNYFPDERGPYNFDLPASNNVGYTNKTTGVKLTSGLTKDGKLVEPQTRWAGIMRALNTNDFESANIEFLEFWVLNPYMAKTDNTPVSKPGSLYFDLGSVSEDIMRDSRQFFENAIPTSNTGGASANTVWGRVPVLPPVVNAFDNDPNLRAIQDVGLDGLNDADEQTFYKDWLAQMQGYLTASAYKDAFSDPSNDNFLYFKDPSFDQTTPGLITRYRKFNNQQGNSPVNNTQNLNPSATNLPDNEDLNRDNSLNENEAYYRYEIPMDVDPMHPNQLYADGPKLKNLVTDIIRDTLNGQMLTWYRFKVPLDYAQRKAINGIQDFRSIRFIRMFMKGFDQRTTFRFAALELGRNQWRRFSQQIPLTKPCITDMVVPDPTVSFDVNKVNIEENAARTPYNYTIPYGIQRQQSVGAFPDILQNEQALAMSVCNLKYCDARGIFKTLNMDIRQFKRIRMFVHAEAKGGDVLDQKSLKVFMRIGSDFVSNYYEYEIPVSPTIQADIAAHMNPDSREYKEAIWKPQNSFDFPLSLLTDLKKQRNATPGVLLSEPFEVPDQNTNNGLNLVRIVGNPNLGLVKGIMFGVRNSDPSLSPHCVELWINELRLSGFNEQGGYAGLARVDMKMADLGNVSLSGSYTSVGWGSIEQKLIQRSQDEIIQYDVSANLALDKLLPAKSGIKVPFYIQYSNITKNPLYDPYDLDIKLKDKIDAEADPIKKAQIREMAQDVTKVHGFNFTNVRKERKGTKKVPLPFDIENFSLTYAFNKLQRRTPFLLNDEQNQYKGAIDYQYSPGLKPIQPFKKLIKNDKYLKFLSEFNFSPLPSNLGFNTTLERLSGTTTYRFAGEDPKLNTYYNRRFTWDRNYSLGWDLTKALRMQFDATAKAIIDEPYAGDQPTTKLVRDSIWKNILHLGRPKSYTHSLNLNYTVPFKNFPFLDFITMKASYTGGYVWTAQSLLLQHMDTPTQFENIPNSRSLGNTIQNTSVRQINGDLDFTKLYDKIPYLARINKGSKGGGPGGGPGGPGGPGGGKGPGGGPGGNPDSGRPGMPGGPGGKMPGGGPGGKGDLSKSLQPAAVGKTLPNTDNPAVGGKDSRSAGGRIDPNAPGGAPGGGPGNPTADPSGAGGKDANGKDTGTAGGGKDKKDKKKKEREPSLAERIALRPLMLIRKARFTYSENYSTVVPGFVPDTKLMGLSEGFNAPGLAFVLGVQPGSSWLDDAAKKGWITYRPELNQQVLRNYTQNIDAGLTVEPFNDFRVEFTGTRQYVHNSTELFKNQNFNSLDPTQVDFQHRAQRDMGSFTVSYFSMNTLFNNDLNGLFRKYESYRPVISKRLATLAGNPDLYDDPNLPINQDPSKNYLKGYGPIQQQVLIPAFIAAYSNQDPNSVGLDLFKMRPALNWKLTYNGLAKVGNLSKVFSSISITHGYKNTLTVNSYNTDIFYDPQHPYGIDQLNYNYIARYEIPQIIINEQMQPLLGVDIKTKNDMSFKVDFKKSRTLALSLVDYQLAETRSSGYTVGFGYKMHNVIIPFLQFGKKTAKAKKAPKKTAKPATPGTKPAPTPASGTGQQANDLTFKFDFDLRDDITLNHRLDVPGDAIPTRGARTIAINPSVEYTINKRLKLRLFSDYRKTVPKTSQSFPITSVQTGIVVQFSLN